MKNSGIVLSLFLLFQACTPDGNVKNNAAFVTLLGTDTLAVERFSWSEHQMIAQVVLRSPATVFSSYQLETDLTGGINSFRHYAHDPSEGFASEGRLLHSVEKRGDSLRVEIHSPNGTRTFSVADEAGVLPFIDMVHWPFEMAFQRAFAARKDTLKQKMLTGNRISDFIVARIEADSMTIRHPSRGVMGANIDNRGRLVHLDAGLTTRKLTVNRYSDIDIESIGRRFAALDAAGSPFGQLSGAEAAEFSFKGTNFRVEYGSPLRRGRELFGGIVPWGERWRTGANRATHFYTSREIRIGNLRVPAGEYTLFTIPQPDGGILMINTQTGQNGQTYDESRDLGRVPMRISTKDDLTEAFTITVEETSSGGVLNLIWGNTVFSVDFAI